MANYQAFSASVQGATHVKKNIVMQDASGKFENEKVKLIVVSDGHVILVAFVVTEVQD